MISRCAPARRVAPMSSPQWVRALAEVNLHRESRRKLPQLFIASSPVIVVTTDVKRELYLLLAAADEALFFPSLFLACKIKLSSGKKTFFVL